MSKYTIAQIQNIKKNQEGWEQLYSQLLDQLQSNTNSNQIEIPSDCFRYTDQYISYRLKKRKCQLCYKRNTFKFIRMKASAQKEHLPFLLCDSCFFSQNKKLPKAIKQQVYTPATFMLKTLKRSLQSLKQPDQIYLNNFQRYDLYQRQLSYMLGQISKIVERNIFSICKQLKEQLQTMKKYSISQQNPQFFNFLMQDDDCKCDCECNKYSQCFKATKQLSADRVKKTQDQFIREINLIGMCSSWKKQENEIMKQILKDVESIILKESGPIEVALKVIAKETQNVCFSKFNSSRAEINKKDLENYQLQSRQIENYRRIHYLREGVINSLTIDHISEISNHTTHLDICSNKKLDKIAEKIESLTNLQKLSINNSQVANTFISSSINSLQKGKQTQSQAAQIKIANKRLIRQLKILEFNCKIPYKKDFTFSLSQFSNLQNLCLNWNLLQSFEKINQAHHYLQDQSVVNSMAPSPFELFQYYKTNKIKYLWIGNCHHFAKEQKQKSQMLKYLEIIENCGKHLEGMMLGQLDGKQRAIDDRIINNCINLANVKVIFFNKISINETDFTKIIDNLHSLQALYLNQCQIPQKCVAKINSLPNLRKLSLVQLRNCAFSQQMPNLQTFILQRCYSDTLPNCFKGSALKTLSLYECRFLQDQFINSLLQHQLKNGAFLSSINLGYTRITNKALQIIERFPQICKLHIGGTGIDLFLWLKQLQNGKFKNLRKIEKLSLKEMKQLTKRLQNNKIGMQVSQYYNDIFANILCHFPILTHLDISFNQVLNERSIRFGLNFLAFVAVAETKFRIQSKKKEGGAHLFYSSSQENLKFIY